MYSWRGSSTIRILRRAVCRWLVISPPSQATPEQKPMPALETDYAVAPHEHEEGDITKAIEYYTGQVPSGVYLSLAPGDIKIPGEARPRSGLPDALKRDG